MLSSFEEVRLSLLFVSTKSASNEAGNSVQAERLLQEGSVAPLRSYRDREFICISHCSLTQLASSRTHDLPNIPVSVNCCYEEDQPSLSNPVRYANFPLTFCPSNSRSPCAAPQSTFRMAVTANTKALTSSSTVRRSIRRMDCSPTVLIRSSRGCEFGDLLPISQPK